MQDENNSKFNKNGEDDVCEVFHPHEDIIERAKKHVLSEDEYTDLSEFFKIFGNPTRLRILRAHNIVKYEKEGKSARYSLTDLHVEMIFKMGLEHMNE